MLGLLKQVSRSFYLSLRLLPKPMREGAGLAYLLARTSDTLADSEAVERDLRLEMLQKFVDDLEEAAMRQPWPDPLLDGVEHPGELELLLRVPELLECFKAMSPRQQGLIRDVIATITQGQLNDLEYFSHGSGEAITAFAASSELDRYTYQVAGCVGEFWTLLGFETLGDGFSEHSPDALVEMGVRYGKGLQLINILRDLPQDLRAGRCYLPVADPQDREALMMEFRRHCGLAEVLIQQGFDYSAQLRKRRLRMASVLPTMIAEGTLEQLRQASWEQLESGIKVSRARVYGCLLQALLH